jgi:hypothetical protein
VDEDQVLDVELDLDALEIADDDDLARMEDRLQRRSFGSALKPIVPRALSRVQIALVKTRPSLPLRLRTIEPSRAA